MVAVEEKNNYFFGQRRIKTEATNFLQLSSNEHAPPLFSHCA
mgnify:CR=1 FL=1